MKILKKVILTATLAIIAIHMMTIITKAATVKVTGDVLNIRKGASTDDDVIAMISKGVECEMIGEEGNWYKVKYKNYTGYISKDYAEIVKETQTNQEKNNIENEEKSNTANTEEGDKLNGDKTNTTSQKETEIKEDPKAENNKTSKDDIQTETKITYKKFNKDVDLRILPLIHSSKIGTMKKNEQVLFITEILGWSYIQSDTISGWVRSDTLREEKTVTTNNSVNTNSSIKGDTSNSKVEKTGYINEEYVNLRKGAGTNYNILKVLTLNTEVTILKEENDWYQVKSEDAIGYVSKEFVSDSKTITNRSNTNSRTENRTKNETETIVGATDGEDIEELKEQSTAINKNTNSNKTTSEKTDKTTSNLNKNNNEDKNKNTEKKETTEATTTKKETIKNNKDDKTKGTDVVAYAKKYLGHKYVYGGNGSNGTFDCSGFTMYVYKHFGINIPHGATSQYKSGKGTKITKQSNLQTGDIVFLTDYETGVGIGHCGIYIGNGNFIHASTTTYTVTISNLNTTYQDRFYAGLRLI